MKEALVEFTWTPSVSSDVVSQLLTIVIAGEEIVNTELDPSSTALQHWVDEKTNVTATVSAYDGTHYSEPAIINFLVGDLEAPVNVTGLGAQVLQVRDKE